MTLRWALALALFIPWSARGAEEGLDDVSRFLTFSSAGGTFHARISGSANLEVYHGNQSTNGFVFTEEKTLFNPKVILFLDTQLGSHFYGFAQARIDRGFDPSSEGLRVRLDEYAVRYTPVNDAGFHLQAGQFASVIGTWVGRHDPWDNPFIGAPMLYENLTAVDEVRAASTFAELIETSEEDEYKHAPIMWGPAYSSGVAAAGRVGDFEYATEIKNAGPSAAPEAWPVHAVGFEHPAFNSRVGFRTQSGWRIGVSHSDSVYLLPVGRKTIPADERRGAYRERLWAQDISYAWHHVQLWAEVFETSFDVPRVGTARTIAGYLETRYKFTPQFFGALRLNRQIFSRLPDDAGVSRRWGENVTRLDAAVVYRFTAHAQVKFQATVRTGTPEKDGPIPAYAAQFTVRF